ncbi:hypothetical protein Q5P01_015120 [Channa striata]|uniref:C2H2-type domain-containing protein n=1 Tax=Channa striata TaxID=64152 RepID=A0AA88SLR2_CHASR|nr:hypothetical protein Q5P01_015120 [Channa striata]
MFSVQCLRAFVDKTLTAAAEEIFRMLEKTIFKYEEEIARQRKLLDIVWKPEVKLHSIELPLQYGCEDEVRQLCSQDRVSGLDAEPQPIKEEEEKLCFIQEGEPVVLKKENDTFMISPAYGASDKNKEQCVYLKTNETRVEKERDTAVRLTLRPRSSEVSELNNDHNIFSHNSHVDENLDHKEGKHEDAKTALNAEPTEEQQELSFHIDNVYNFPSDSQYNPKTSTKSIKCDVCGKSYKYVSRLSAHLRSHTGEKPYSCKICTKRFSATSALKRHNLTHTGEKPYLCSICGKKFFRKSSMISHLRIHTGERPYFCHTCGKSFSQASGLSVHFRIHTGEKPYVCKTCGRCFRRNNVLKLHMRTHTGERPYLCKTCGKRFNDTSGLKRHMKIHKDEK